MPLDVPTVNIAPRRSRLKVGHFVSEAAFGHFLSAYQNGMAELPPFSGLTDVPTSFGVVRTYRFEGPTGGSPVVLLPGRNASTPMWRANIASLQKRRTVIGVDLLGEAGLSVQHKPITGPEDEAQWLDDVLAGLGHERAHLMGVSIGGWTAANCAIRRPERIASVCLLDPVMTFAPLTAKAILSSLALFPPGVPEVMRRRVLRWISGGADVTDAESETRLISAGSRDFVLRKAMPRAFTDEQLRALGTPVLALIAGRSVMHDSARAAERARKLLPHGQIDVYPNASHAINGEYAEKIAERAQRFWGELDA